MKCTHNCKTCKCNINDVNGFPCCIYFGTISDDIYWVMRDLSGHAIEYFNGRNKLYFYADGLYLYDPITCIKKQVNYKMRKSDADVSGVTGKKYTFIFEKIDIKTLKDWEPE